MKLLENKTAIITGATRGIGKGIAIEFAKQGLKVLYIVSVDAETIPKGKKSLLYLDLEEKFKNYENIILKQVYFQDGSGTNLKGTVMFFTSFRSL